MKTIISIILLFGIGISLNCQEAKDTARFVSVDPDDFLTQMRFAENPVIIDVRMRSEYRNGHIEGSVNLPVSKTEKLYRNHVPDSSTVLVYCTTGVRSKWAADKYYKLGFRKIYNLAGGIEAWKRKGLSVTGKKKKGSQ